MLPLAPRQRGCRGAKPVAVSAGADVPVGMVAELTSEFLLARFAQHGLVSGRRTLLVHRTPTHSWDGGVTVWFLVEAARS